MKINKDGTPRKMSTGCLPVEVSKRIDAGGWRNKKTLTEWALEFNITYQRMSGVLVLLRSNWGKEYHPYQGEMTVKGVKKFGVIVDINKNEEYLVTGTNFYRNNTFKPHMISQFRIINEGIKNFPLLVSELIPFIEETQIAVIEANKKAREEQKKTRQKEPVIT